MHQLNRLQPSLAFLMMTAQTIDKSKCVLSNRLVMFVYCNFIFIIAIRILTENKTLIDNLEERKREIQQLRADNAGN